MLPAQFAERMKEMLGNEYEEFEACYEREKYRALRFNPLKGQVSAFLGQALFSLNSVQW